MRTNRLFFVSSLSALIVGAGLLVACSDDESSPNQNTDDADAQVPPGNDSGSVPGTDEDGGVLPEPDGGNGNDATAPADAIIPAFATKIPGALNPYGVTLGSDGKIYVAGASAVVTDATTTPATTDRQLTVWRYTPAGKLDTTFGTDGLLTVAIPGDETAYDIVELKSGDFVVHAASAGKVYLTKLAKGGDGSFTFGTPTAVSFDWSDGDFSTWPGTTATPATTPSYSSWGIALDSSGSAEKIVVFAFGAPAKTGDVTTQRVDNDRWITRVLVTDGFPIDPAFNGGKPYVTDVDNAKLSDGARRGIVLKDGSIVSSGYTNFPTAGGNNVALIKLTPAGIADTTFGFGSAVPGQTKFNPFAAKSGFAEAYNVAEQSNGRLVTTGYGTSNFAAPSVKVDVVSFGVLRDQLDVKYGDLGSTAIQSEIDPSAGLGPTESVRFEERGRDLAVLADDRVVHAGRYDGHAAFMVTTKDGALDTSVGQGGVIQYNLETQFFKVASVMGGKYVLATAQSVSVTNPSTSVTTTDALFVALKVGN